MEQRFIPFSCYCDFVENIGQVRLEVHGQGLEFLIRKPIQPTCFLARRLLKGLLQLIQCDDRGKRLQDRQCLDCFVKNLIIRPRFASPPLIPEIANFLGYESWIRIPRQRLSIFTVHGFSHRTPQCDDLILHRGNRNQSIFELPYISWLGLDFT